MTRTSDRKRLSTIRSTSFDFKAWSLFFLHIISEIKLLVGRDRECKFVKVDRGQVRVSHCLANWTRTENITAFWFGSGPDIMLQELTIESLVIPVA